MAADAAGNDLEAVGIPLTGAIAIAPHDTTLLTPEQGKAKPLTLDTAYRRLGLLTDDGGLEWTEEPDGDAIEFWQDGYKLPTGKAKCELKVTLAQTDTLGQELRAGKTPDEHGYVAVDAGGHATIYRLWTEEVFKNGVIRRRQVGQAQVAAAKLAKSKRGEVLGTEVTFNISYDTALGGHYGEWLVKP